MRKTGATRNQASMVRVIGIFKLLNVLALLSIGSGAYKLMHRDLAVAVDGWLQQLGVDPHSHFFEAVIRKISNINASRMALLSAGTFFYASLFLAEGIGLILRKRWAEFFTVIVT